jgi:tRNA pseudouridine-54 N-methylase
MNFDRMKILCRSVMQSLMLSFSFEMDRNWVDESMDGNDLAQNSFYGVFKK